MENGHAHANDDDSNIDALLEERQRMMGKLFNNAVPEEYAERYMRTRQLIHKFNNCKSPEFGPGWRFGDLDCSPEQAKLLAEIFDIPIFKSMFLTFKAPLYVDYGPNVDFEGIFSTNYGCIIAGRGKVTIGRRVAFGPNVQLIAESYPIDVEGRRQLMTEPQPIIIGNEVWIGGGVVVNGPCRIGHGVTVAAGSVVQEDIPDNVVVGGVPARIIKRLDAPPPIDVPVEFKKLFNLAVS